MSAARRAAQADSTIVVYKRFVPRATRSDDAVVALADLLARRCLGQSETAAPVAEALLSTLSASSPDPLALAAAAGGAWAAFPTGRRPLDADVRRAAAASARALAGEGGAEPSVILGAAALGLLAMVRSSGTSAADLVFAAACARSVERHRLAAGLASEAVARAPELTPSQFAHANLLLAVIERDPSVVASAYKAVRALPEDDPVRRVAAVLEPTVVPDNTSGDSPLAAAVEAGDRLAAAREFAAQIDELRSIADDDLLRGLEVAALALTTADIDAESARNGLADVWRHWRRRSRTGESPPVALAGIEILMDLLLLAPDEARGDILVELVEALSDAGLASVGTLGRPEAQRPDAAALAHVRLSATALERAAWPDLGRIARALGDTHALFVRTKRLLSDRRMQVLVLHVVPPDGLSIRQHILTPPQVACLSRLTGAPPGPRRVTQASIDDLVSALLPRTLWDAIADGSAARLVVIPDTTLWPIPWQWARPLVGCNVAVVQSLSTWTALPPASSPIRRVTAIIDERIRGSAPVLAALDQAQRHGQLDTQSARSLDHARNLERADLLVVYTHGSGRGLDYRLALPDGGATALELASAQLAPRGLIAACSSGAPPPDAFPLSLANALMLNGTATVVAGLWPLPGVATGRLVGELLRTVASGDVGLAAALRQVLAAAVGPVVERCGLHLFGRDDGIDNLGASSR